MCIIQEDGEDETLESIILSHDREDTLGGKSAMNELYEWIRHIFSLQGEESAPSSNASSQRNDGYKKKRISLPISHMYVDTTNYTHKNALHI